MIRLWEIMLVNIACGDFPWIIILCLRVIKSKYGFRHNCWDVRGLCYWKPSKAQGLCYKESLGIIKSKLEPFFFFAFFVMPCLSTLRDVFLS